MDYAPFKLRKHQERLKSIPFNRIIPNAITTMSLCAGFSGIRYALETRWDLAIICIFVAAILDGMDGRVARLLGSESRFGAELDSLADACNFGVAPALIIYSFALHELKQAGWAIALFYVVCMLFRLARFNVFLDDEAQDTVLSSRFFTGLCAPLGAICGLVPLMIYLEFDKQLTISPLFYGVYLMVIAVLLVSRLPTYSIKGGAVPKQWAWPFFVGLGGVGVLIVTEPWLTIVMIAVGYLISIPFSYKTYQRLKALSAPKTDPAA